MDLGPKFSASYCFCLTVAGENPSEHFLFEKKEETNLNCITSVIFLIHTSCVPDLLKTFIIKSFITITTGFSRLEKFR